FILMRTAVELEVQLGAPILSAAARSSLHGSGKDYQTLQDLQLLRGFLTSVTLIAFLDGAACQHPVGYLEEIERDCQQKDVDGDREHHDDH
ncbi:hypothetical protein ACDA55_37080, partial [Rhizobium ruizarguesonis]